MALISGIFFFTLRGDLLLSRLYRPEIPKNIADTFRYEIVAKKPDRRPLKSVSGVSYMYLRHENLYLVALAARNANAALVYQFMYQLLAIFKVYFHMFDAAVLRAHYVLIFELLDEVMDYGHPQIMEPDSLKLIVPSDEEKRRIEGLKRKGIEVTATGSAITITATGAQNWRAPGIRYKKNEIFLDLIERMNYLLSAKGQILRTDVEGVVKVRCKLSGMPGRPLRSPPFPPTLPALSTHPTRPSPWLTPLPPPPLPRTSPSGMQSVRSPLRTSWGVPGVRSSGWARGALAAGPAAAGCRWTGSSSTTVSS